MVYNVLSIENTVFHKKYGKHFGHTWIYFQTLKGAEMKAEDIVHNALPLTNMYAKYIQLCHD